MSKSSSLKFLVVGTVWVVCRLAAQPAPQQSVAPPAAPKQAPVSSSRITALTDEVLKQVSEIRGLSLLRPVRSGAKSRTEIRSMVIKNFDEETTPAELNAEFMTMAALGLVPKDFKYREFLVNLLTEQIAGFYDPKKKEFNLADWNPLEMQKPVMAHELTHALQDQHFNLARFDKWPKDDGDRELAIHALIEGDATALMIDYLMKPMGTTITRLPQSVISQMNAQMTSSGMKEFDSAPNAIRESLVFPYSYGLLFAYDLLRTKGWQGVSDAFNDLPQSTEQIMHFGKYLKHEMPVKVELADIASDLGREWKRITRNVNGEFNYYLILAEYIDKVEARRAAEGWGGDQCIAYENGGAVALTHLSYWDTKLDAEEFYAAYLARTRKFHPEAREIDGEHEWRTVLTTTSGNVLIEMRGRSVLVVEGVRVVDKLAEKLWASKVAAR